MKTLTEALKEEVEGFEREWAAIKEPMGAFISGELIKDYLSSSNQRIARVVLEMCETDLSGAREEIKKLI